MKSNVGGTDRIVRILVGIAVLTWGAYAQSWWGLIGAVPLLTGVIGWCPPYSIFGINTCSMKEKSE